jgi:hypothetical protein
MATDSIDMGNMGDLGDPALLAAQLAEDVAAAARICDEVADRRATAALGVSMGIPGAAGRYKALNGEYEGALAEVKRLGQARKGADSRRARMAAQATHDVAQNKRQSINALVDERRTVIAKAEKQMRGLAANLTRADELAARIVDLRGPVPDFPSNVHPEGLGPVPVRERIRRAAVGMGLGDWLGIKAAFIDASRPVSSLVALEDHAMGFARLCHDGKPGERVTA